MNLHIFKYNRIQVSELLKDTIDFLVDKFNQSKKVFSVSSVYGQILFVLENLTNLMFYYIEDSTTEQSIREATRDSSVYGIASEAGYMPSRSISAIGQISITPKTSITQDVVGNIVNIPNYLKIKCINNDIQYMIELAQDEIRYNITNNNVFNINILQGYIDTQIITGYGTPYASYPVNFPKNYHIDNRWIKVHVNDVIQPIYDSILKIPKGEPGCMIRTGITSGIDVFFGNGNFGSYPQLGSEIRVEFLVTDGYGGNINTDNVNDIIFEFSESGFDAVGNEVNLNEIFDIATIVSPSFGANAEPIELTRLMLSKSNSILLVESDYELLLKRMQSFSIIRIFRDKDNDRVFNIFLIPDATKLVSPNIDYFNIPLTKFTLSDDKKSQILKYIEKMGTKTISTDIKIIDPVIRKYVLNISLVIFSDVDEDIIKRDIVDEISTYFLTISRQDRIPRSDLIKLIENVNGVDSVNIRIVSEQNEISKISNPNNPDVGLDELNDIIINNKELVVIRGGWSDRYGNVYDTTYNDMQKLGAINIRITKINNK
jgi:hypothetical protein